MVKLERFRGWDIVSSNPLGSLRSMPFYLCALACLEWLLTFHLSFQIWIVLPTPPSPGSLLRLLQHVDNQLQESTWDVPAACNGSWGNLGFRVTILTKTSDRIFNHSENIIWVPTVHQTLELPSICPQVLWEAQPRKQAVATWCDKWDKVCYIRVFWKTEAVLLSPLKGQGRLLWGKLANKPLVSGKEKLESGALDHSAILTQVGIKIPIFWDFHGDPVVKTLSFEYRGLGFDHWTGN